MVFLPLFTLISLFSSCTIADVDLTGQWASGADVCAGFTSDWYETNDLGGVGGGEDKKLIGGAGGIPTARDICFGAGSDSDGPIDVQCLQVGSNGTLEEYVDEVLGLDISIPAEFAEIIDFHATFRCFAETGVDGYISAGGYDCVPEDDNCPDFRVRFCCEQRRTNPFVFVIDDTGSMSQEIAAVANTIKTLIPGDAGDTADTVPKEVPEYFVLSTFDNPGNVDLADIDSDTLFCDPTITFDDDEFYYFCVERFDTAGDIEPVIENDIQIGGGGASCGEYSLTGINNAIAEVLVPEYAADGVPTDDDFRVEMFLFTDEDANEWESFNNGDYSVLTANLATYKVRLHMILTGSCFGEIPDVFKDLTSLRGGLLITTDDEEVESTAELITEFIEATEVGLYLEQSGEIEDLAVPFESGPGSVTLSGVDGTLSIIVSSGFNTNPMANLQVFCTGGFQDVVVADSSKYVIENKIGFSQIVVDVEALIAAVPTGGDCLPSWQVYATFSPDRRRRDLLQTSSSIIRVVGFLTDVKVAVTFDIYQVSDNVISEINGRLYCGDDEAFRIYAFPRIVNSNDNSTIVDSIDSMTVTSRNGNASVEADSSDIVYDSTLDGYYADFECNDLNDLGIEDFRVIAIGTASDLASGNSGTFQRTYDFVIELTQISVTLKCDDTNTDGVANYADVLECDLEVDVNSMDIINVTIDVSVDNPDVYDQFVDISVSDSVLTSFPATTTVSFALTCSENTLFGSEFTVVIKVASDDLSDATVIRETIAISQPYLYPTSCGAEVCDCDLNEHCLICHDSSGCAQCESGYFQKSLNHLCQSCDESFGEACLVCNDAFGCSQCKDGFVHSYDECSGLHYCQNSTIAGSDETGGVDLGDYLCPNDCGDEGCSCINCEPQTTCNGYCSQCESGYFKLSNNHNCVDCEMFFGEGCMFCQDYHGCGQCKQGYTRTYNGNCGDNGVWYCHPN